MTRVLHLIDRNTPADMLAQLAVLADPADEIISVGRPPELPGGHEVRAIHEPVGSAVLCGSRIRPLVGEASVVHVWSARAQRSGQVAVSGGKARLLRSVPAVPRTATARSRLLRSLAREAVTVTVPTQAARDTLTRAGFPAQRACVLPAAAASIDDLAGRRRRTRAELGLPDDALVLVAPDAMVRAANLACAIWAHAIMEHVLDDPSWLIMPTGGPMERAVMAFARGAGFIERIVGPWPADRLADALAAADIAMFVRTDDCGSSAVAAAMTAGLPIAAFDTPDVIECAGPAALPTEARTPRAAGQALLRLIEQPELARQLADHARSRAGDFSPQAVKPVLADIYDALSPGELEGARSAQV